MTRRLINWRPFTHIETAPLPIEIIRAKDALLFDKDGKSYIDAISSWWVITHGHCHPKIVNAVANTAQKLDQMVFANFTHAPAEELFVKLGNMLPQDLVSIFLSDNGSTSVEIALKMAVHYWQLLGQEHKNKIVSLAGSYHGDTVGCMSVSARGVFTDPYKNLLFDVVQLTDAKMSLTDDTAAIIIEPLVQGVGGMIMWDRALLLEIINEARKKNIIVIFDEVMTGFFRTGKRFAFLALDVVPDILCLSKGLTGGFLPLAATVCHKRIYEAFLGSDKKRMLFHGHSFTGNPISCAAAVANLELMDDGMEEKIERIEQYYFNRLSSMQSPLIKEKRHLGCIAAIELHSDDGYLAGVAPRIIAFGLKHGVFLRPLGNVIYTMPPYGISLFELDQVWDVIELSLRDL